MTDRKDQVPGRILLINRVLSCPVVNLFAGADANPTMDGLTVKIDREGSN